MTEPGDFTHSYFSYFWDQRAPHVVKHDMERRTGTLLGRVKDSNPLTYVGEQTYLWLRARIELRLEAATLNGTLYSLRFDAARAHNIYDEARFLTDSERAFEHWLRDLHTTQNPGSIELASGERYERLVESALAFEARQAAMREDESVVAAAQQAVLDALGAGKRYARADHEGITVIRLEGTTLVKRRTGESTSEERYGTPEEMLAFLRSYFDWDACRDTYPHKPPEAEIWKFIGYQFE